MSWDFGARHSLNVAERRGPRRPMGGIGAGAGVFETHYAGLSAVGDVRSGSTKRMAAVVGMGPACVSSVPQYLALSPSRVVR